MPRRKGSAEARAVLQKQSPVRKAVARTGGSRSSGGSRRRRTGSKDSGRSGGARRRRKSTGRAGSAAHDGVSKSSASSLFSFSDVEAHTPDDLLLLSVPALKVLAAELVLSLRLDQSQLPTDIQDFLLAMRVPKRIESRFHVGDGRLTHAYAVVALDEERVALAVGKYVQVWHWRSSECLVSMSGHRGDVLCLGRLWDARHIVSGALDHSVRVWDCSTGKCVAKLFGHVGKVYCVAGTHDGQHIVTGGIDCSIRVWTWSDHTCRATLRGHRGGVRSVVILPDDVHVVSGGDDWTIRQWHLRSHECVRQVATSEPVVSMSLLRNDRHLVVTCEDAVALWDWRKGVLDRKMIGHRDLVMAVTCFGDGVHAVSCSMDGTARVWDCLRGVCKAELTPHHGTVNQVSAWVDPNDHRRHVVSVDASDVRIWS